MAETCRMCGLDRASGHLSWCPAWGGWGSIPALPLGTVGDGKLGVEENRVEPIHVSPGDIITVGNVQVEATQDGVRFRGNGPINVSWDGPPNIVWSPGVEHEPPDDLIDNRRLPLRPVEPLAGTQAVMDAIDSSNALGRITSAVLVAIKNLEATEVAGIASIAHVIRSLKDVLAHV